MKMYCLILLSTFIVSAQSYYEGGELRELTPEATPQFVVKSSQRSNTDVKWFRTETGLRVGVTESILVQWKKGADSEAVLSECGVMIFEKMTKTIWKLSVPTGANVFELSQTLYENEATIFAHPNMIRERKLR